MWCFNERGTIFNVKNDNNIIILYFNEKKSNEINVNEYKVHHISCVSFQLESFI